MSDFCISVENLGKKYTLGAAHHGAGLRHVLEEAMRSFFRPFSKGKGGRERSRQDNEFLALDDVSFQVKPGEVLGIIGRNGAGKSTLLKILSRITPPTTGQVRVRGRIASLLEVGTGFHPDLTGRENIYLNGAILGMSRAEIARKFDEIVAFAEIERFIDTPVKRYSSGMYVRLAFAVAAHLEPEILIIDEVLAVGDAQFQKKCIGKMTEVSQGQGRTVLFVSHQMAAVRKLCTSAMLLSAGKTTGARQVEEVIQEYLGQMTASEREIDLTKVPHLPGCVNTAVLEYLRVDEKSSLTYGEPLVFHVHVKCHGKINDAVLGIGIDTAEGYRVMTLDTDIRGQTFHLTQGSYVVTLRIPRNPLSPGLYSLSCVIMSGGSPIPVDGCIAGVWEVLTGVRDTFSFRQGGACRPDFEVEISPES